MSGQNNELTPEQLEKIAGGVSGSSSTSSAGYRPESRFYLSSSTTARSSDSNRSINVTRGGHQLGGGSKQLGGRVTE